ncbi:CD109 antigen-like [Penaeus japonicus]|uniref:CD109 antigen-like n=1 Tax=Penaeus japonicus TaxID=27405 RepID=UPI001C715188|nr:CD109 antigen-like [Penaeus japonicus]
MLSLYRFVLLNLLLHFGCPTAGEGLQREEEIPGGPFGRRGWRKEMRQDAETRPLERDRWRNAVGVLDFGRYTVRKNSSYLVLAPTIARPDSVYKFLVGVLKAEMPVRVRASLSSAGGEEIGQDIQLILPGEMKTMLIKLPQATMTTLGEGSALLKVEGREGNRLVFRNITHIATVTRFLSVLVEMNRPIYNGKQKVQFRVVLLKRDLTPYDGPVDVFVLLCFIVFGKSEKGVCAKYDLLDPGYVMRRWVSRFPNIGIVQLSFSIPGLPKPGWWRIKVVAGRQVDEQPFLVTKFFPRAFEVNVEMPFYTAASEEAVRGRFLAVFKTYMPVSGNASVVLYKKSPLSLPDSAFTEVARKDYHIVNGWHNFSFPTDLLTDETTTDLRQVEAMVKVNVHNIFEGSTLSGRTRTRFVSDQVRVAFVGPDSFVFKPGMPLSGVVTVKHEDLAPLEEVRLQGSHLTLRASVTLASGARTDLPQIVVRPKAITASSSAHLLRRWTYGNASENVYFPQMEDFFHLASTATYRRSGMLRFTISVPKEASSLQLSAVYKDAKGSASATASGVRTHSRTQRYLHVTSSTVTARVGEFAIFHVRANFRMEKFQYLVMAKGVMVYSATEELSTVGTNVVWTVSLTVSREMCPRFTVVVIHVAQDGELMTDSVHIAVSLQSLKASVTLNQRKDHTKRSVEAAMIAPPGAVLAVSCLRRASFVLQPSSRVTWSRLLRTALVMEPHPRSVHHARLRPREGQRAEHLETLSAENTAASKLTSLHFSGLSLAMDAALDSPAGTGNCDGQLGFLECGDGSCYRQLEVCDGRAHCLNGADEADCLTIDNVLREDSSSDRQEEVYRIKHRSYWRTLFDMKNGDWCYYQQNFGHKPFQRAELAVPNAPSTWVVESFVIHPTLGFSVLEAVRYDSTPPLFMSLEATPVCRRGEQVSVRVHLRNALPRKMSVLVVVEGSAHHRFINVEEGGRVSHFRPRLSSGDHQHLVVVEGGGWTQVMFPLAVMKQSGKVTVTIRALTQVGSDTRSVTVQVQPEGASVRKHTSVLLDLKSRATVYEFLDLPVDESPVISKSIFRRYVYGSPKAKVTLSGDVFGPTSPDMTLNFQTAFKGRKLKSTDGIAFNFGSTVWTLHYLRLTNQLDVTKAKKAFEFLNAQLAGLFTRYRDGAFRMWKASTPSVWMTAWVLSVLLPAQLEEWENLVYIEPRLINTAIAFILENQQEDGSFKEPFTNVTLDHKMSSKRRSWPESDGEEASIPLTALVTTVLHEASPTLVAEIHSKAITAREKAIRYLEQSLESVWEPYELAITAYALTLVNSQGKETAAKMLEGQARVAVMPLKRCIRYLEQSLESVWEPYELAITAYALTLVNSQGKETAAKMLEGQARVADGKIHWSKKAIESNVRRAEDSQHSFLLPKEPQEWDSYAVEATSYALMVFLMREGITGRQEAIVEWLTSVRDWNRAFSSSVDTVVALRALAEYSYRARLRDVTALRVRMTATSFPDAKTNISIGRESLSLMRSVPIVRPWGHVNLVAEGAGQAVAQLEVSWGVDLERYLKRPARKYFDLEVTETYPHFRNKTLITTTACARWVAEDVSSTSHAAMLEIDMASGYILPQPNANAAVKRNRKTFPELVNSLSTADKIFWQFQFVPSKQRQCFSFSARRRFPVANLTAIRSATIFELFAPEHFESVVINVTSLAALDVCEVCASYQCPYCPFYSGRGCLAPSLPAVVLLAVSAVLALQTRVLQDL